MLDDSSSSDDQTIGKPSPVQKRLTKRTVLHLDSSSSDSSSSDSDDDSFDNYNFFEQMAEQNSSEEEVSSEKEISSEEENEWEQEAKKLNSELQVY